MPRYHINRKGEPGRCDAALGNCPFGSAEEHYGSKAEAQKAYEESMPVTAPAQQKRKRKVASSFSSEDALSNPKIALHEIVLNANGYKSAVESLQLAKMRQAAGQYVDPKDVKRITHDAKWSARNHDAMLKELTVIAESNEDFKETLSEVRSLDKELSR